MFDIPIANQKRGWPSFLEDFWFYSTKELLSRTEANVDVAKLGNPYNNCIDFFITMKLKYIFKY